MAASITVQLTINTNTATSDSLNLLVNAALSTENPTVGIAREEIGTSTPVEIITGAAMAKITYMYLKNVSPSGVIVIYTDAGDEYSTLNAGEFAFLPVKEGVGIEAKAFTSACVLEYAYFTRP